MDPHRLAELRSLELHRRIAMRMRQDSSIVGRARARVRSWAGRPGVSPFFVDAWQEALALPLDQLCALLVDPAEHAARLRQATPFAGVIGPRERWSIWREAKAASS